MNTIFSTNMAVSMISAFFLDNTIPASRKDRGMHVWDKFRDSKSDPRSAEFYALPWGLGRFFKWAWWVGI
jgi:nucleobase transporter 1/2